MAGDTGDEPAEDSAESLPPDDLFELLSHHRRRYVIECLDRYGSPMSLPDLADECVVMEHQTALDDIPAETVKRMYMSLYHCHIPKLVTADAIDYDQESDSVATGPTASQLRSHLTLARSSLPSPTESALEKLRNTTANENESLTIEQASRVLQRAGYDEESTIQILDRLENTGYVHFVNGYVRLIG